MNTSNQALAFINSVSGVKNINVTVKQAVHSLYTRTAKTAGASGAGGLSYIKEVQQHESISKGKSMGAVAMRALMVALLAEGLLIGKRIAEGNEFPQSDIEKASNTMLAVFDDSIKAQKELKALKAKATAEGKDSAVNNVPVESVNSEADNVDGVSIIKYEDADVLSVSDDTLIDVNGAPVAFSDLKNAFITMQVKSLITPTNINTKKEGTKQAVNA